MNNNPFEAFTNEYENWFKENSILFQSELLALKKVIPFGKKGIENCLFFSNELLHKI